MCYRMKMRKRYTATFANNWISVGFVAHQYYSENFACMQHSDKMSCSSSVIFVESGNFIWPHMQFQQILLLGALVVGFLAAFWLFICALLHENIPNKLPPQEDYIFDFVVVGAGTAGSVVASLLSKHNPESSVLLVEAGDTFGLLSKIPLLSTFQQKGLNDWSFISTPQKHSSMGLEERRQCLPRGKGLGGSDQLNFMLHFDGQPLDFENWASNHNLSDWQWNDVKPFLKAALPNPTEMLEIMPQYSKISEAFHQCESEFWHKKWSFRRAHYNIKNGLRHNIFQMFLRPALTQANLYVFTNAMAKRINLINSTDGGKRTANSLQVGVKDFQGGREQIHTVHIRRTLIVCAGAYQTPQLLLTSGIGEGITLNKLNIPQQHQLPRVGHNLHDHFNLPLFISINCIGPTLNQRALLDPLQMLKYLINGGGHLGNFGVLGHIRGSYAESFGLTFFGAGAIDERALMSISNFKREHFRALFPRYHNTTQEGFVVISTCFQPKSRGTVSIASANIRKNPLIDPNYLSKNEDVRCTINAVRAAVKVVNSQSFAALGPRIHWPKIKECANFGPFEEDFQSNMPSDRYLECIMRHVGLGSHHPGGSCAMGTSVENSAVDSQFRVHGIENLRVVDASVLPTPISGNPNSIIAGMAIRGATMILEEELMH